MRRINTRSYTAGDRGSGAVAYNAKKNTNRTKSQPKRYYQLTQSLLMTVVRDASVLRYNSEKLHAEITHRRLE